jgi:hypothetical protein
MNNHTAVFESPHYAQTRARLAADPIVQAMAQEMINDLGAAAALDRFGGDSGHIPFAIMNGALTEYARRGGQRGGHIGGVAEAMVSILTSARAADEQPQPRCPDCRVPITDLESYFGVHLADCGYWDERCHRCHKLIPAGTASIQRPDLCRACAETPGSVNEGSEPQS